MTIHFVGKPDEIPEDGRAVVSVEGRSIGIYRVKGEFYALNNYCPHQGAPICAGLVSGTNLPSGVYEYEYGMSGEIVRCPWHGWEFNIRTGKSLFDPKVFVKTFPVVVKDGKIGVDLERKPPS